MADYIDPEREEVNEEVYYAGEDYSEEDLEKIRHDADEARRGINIVGPFPRMKDAIAYLNDPSTL